MNKITWVVSGLILIAAIFGAYFVIKQSQQPAPAPTGTGNAAVGANGASSVITYTDKGFSPSLLSVAQGTTITWVNQSSRTMWIEGTGPSGGNCSAPGTQGTLNECAALSEGGSYSYTFVRIGTFPYFNHSQSSDTGVIDVTAAAVSGPINPQATPE